MRLFSDAVFIAAARTLTLVLAGVVSVLTARTLGPAGRGAYSLPSIDSGLAATFMFGLSSAVSYFMLNRRAGKGLLRPALLGVALAVLAGGIVTFAIASSNRHLFAVLPALLYLPAYGVLSLVSGYFVGRDRIRYWSIVNVSTWATTLVFMLVGFAVLGRTPAVAIGAWISGTCVVAIAGAIAVIRSSRTLDGEAPPAAEFLFFAAKAGALNVMALLNYRIDVYIVAMLAPISTLGMYVVAVAGAESALAITCTGSMVTAPRIGSLGKSDAADFTARCSRNSLFVALVTCGLASLVLPWAVLLLFGHAYGAIVNPLRVLLGGVVALSLGGAISNYFMLNLGRAYVPITTSGLSAVVCALISFALVPRLGMLGAAIGTTTAYIVGQAAATVWFCRATGMRPHRLLLLDRADIAFYRALFARFRTRHA